MASRKREHLVHQIVLVHRVSSHDERADPESDHPPQLTATAPLAESVSAAAAGSSLHPLSLRPV
jgi:hypothetical protein